MNLTAYRELDGVIAPGQAIQGNVCRSPRGCGRLIIAQAHLEGMVLGTQDRRMRAYDVVTLGLD